MDPTSEFDDLLAVESAYYNRHRDELLMKYPNKILLIHGDGLVRNFETVQEAIAEGVRRFGTEPFLVRRSGESEPVLFVPALQLGILQCQ